MVENMEISNKLIKMEDYAEKFNIPIMQKDGITFLSSFIEKNKIINILEIGTAIAYSTIKMALVDENIKITSIEKDKERYEIAKKNIEEFKLKDRIELIFGDALNIELEQEYDLVFIDAAKAQNKNLFLKYEKNLKKGGYIVTDNLNFHGYVNKELGEIKSKNIRALVRKIKDYINFLNENEDYETTFYQIGDGVSVSRRI